MESLEWRGRVLSLWEGSERVVPSTPEGDLQLASHYCELSCGSVEATMGATSIELGRELHKLALLFFQR